MQRKGFGSGLDGAGMGYSRCVCMKDAIHGVYNRYSDSASRKYSGSSSFLGGDR